MHVVITTPAYCPLFSKMPHSETRTYHKAENREIRTETTVSYQFIVYSK